MADLSVTAASVLPGLGAVKLVGIVAAGVTITQGQYLCQLSDLTIGLADSNGTSPANSICGVALTGGSPGQPIVYATAAPKLVTGATLVSGDAVWLSNTPGGITKTYADIASGSTVILLGAANTDLSLNFSPIVAGVK